MLALPQLLNLRVGFVSRRARNRFRWIPFRFISEFLFTCHTHLGMALNVLRERDPDLFFIFEHKANYSLPLYLALLFRRRPVFFFVHDMQQVANTTFRGRMALQLCGAWVRCGEFYPLYISLDDAGLPAKRRFEVGKTLAIPHPHHLAENPPPWARGRMPGEAFRVGIIGTVRKEKPIRKLLEILRQAQQRLGFELVVGTPRASVPPWLGKINAEILDTTTETHYSACLSSLDIFVVDFVHAEYYFRPSGAVVDAGMNGCYVICPDFPVFRAQIGQPVSIGETFRTVTEVPLLIERAMQRLEQGPIDSETWRQYHRVENIAAQMQGFLEQRAALNGRSGNRKAVVR